MRQADGETIWQYIWRDVVLRWGKPETFLSDKGTEFKNQLIDGKLHDLGITLGNMKIPRQTIPNQMVGLNDSTEPLRP